MSGSFQGKPEADKIPVATLLDWVRTGVIRVPPFQRGWRWQQKDILLLLDSVYRGYPIGTLFFQRSPAPAARLTVGPLVIDAPAHERALWVVDGQQRLTALAGVLLHRPNDPSPRDDFQVYFDLEREVFEKAPPSQPPSHWLPLDVALDQIQLLDWVNRRRALVDWRVDPQQKGRFERTAFGLNASLRQYEVPTYTVETNDEVVLREIFDRLNSGGKRLTKEEVFGALRGGLTADEPSDLRALGSSLEKFGLGQVEQRWLLRSILAIEGLDVTRVGTELRRIPRGAKELPRAERSLRSVLVFLSQDARIPRLEVLPYRGPIVVLAKFFDRHPQAGPRSRALLARWLWRGATAVTDSSALAPKLRRQLAAIDHDEEESVQRLLALLPEHPPPATRLAERFSLRAARTRVEVGMLAALGPRELGTGKPLPLADLLAAEQIKRSLHELFREPGKGIENRVLYWPRTGSSELLAAIAAETSSEILVSHGITAQTQQFLRSGDAPGFFKSRRASLTLGLADFVALRAQWDASDRKSLAALAVEEDAAGGL